MGYLDSSLLGLLILAAQIICGVHAYRNGRYLWIALIIFVPVRGRAHLLFRRAAALAARRAALSGGRNAGHQHLATHAPFARARGDFKRTRHHRHPPGLRRRADASRAFGRGHHRARGRPQRRVRRRPADAFCARQGLRRKETNPPTRRRFWKTSERRVPVSSPTRCVCCARACWRRKASWKRPSPNTARSPNAATAKSPVTTWL